MVDTLEHIAADSKVRRAMQAEYWTEIIDCILQYNPEVEIVDGTFKTVLVRNKNLAFHLLPVPFARKDLPGQEDPAGLHTPTFFQEQSLEYASRGIQSVHLWQDVWVAKQKIVRSRIAVLSGSGVRIMARRTKLRRITRDVMFDFFATNHLQGFVDARYNYGLFSGGQLLAAASFSSGRKMKRNGITVRSFELLRYANLLHHRVTGGLGKLIAHFIKDVNPGDIMTYADLDWSSGRIYQTLNFVQTAVTPPLAFWIHPAEMIRYSPHRLPKNLTNEFCTQERYTDMDDFLKDKGYEKIHNAGNLKYLLICNC